MEFILVLIVIAVAIPLQLMVASNHENKINEKIHSIGGELIGFEKCGFMGDKGPFYVIGKGRTIYKIKYRINEEVQVGWVRFGGLFEPDWRL